MTEPTITLGLAGVGVTILIGLQALRATHYDDKLDKLKEKFSVWLQQIENELKTELKTLIAQPSADPSIDKIVEISSKFSAVKEMDSRVDELHTSNENSIRSTIVVMLIVAGVAFGLLFTTDLSLIEFGVLVGAGVWLGSVYSVHQFMGEYNKLCESERKRKV